VSKIAYVNDFYANIGTIRTGGIDFASVHAAHRRRPVRLRLRRQLLAFYNITLKLKSGDAKIQGKDTYDAGLYGALPQFKATSGLDWSLGGFLAGLTGR